MERAKRRQVAPAATLYADVHAYDGADAGAFRSLSTEAAQHPNCGPETPEIYYPAPSATYLLDLPQKMYKFI